MSTISLISIPNEYIVLTIIQNIMENKRKNSCFT